MLQVALNSIRQMLIQLPRLNTNKFKANRVLIRLVSAANNSKYQLQTKLISYLSKFMYEIATCSALPVYFIGGITPDHLLSSSKSTSAAESRFLNNKLEVGITASRPQRCPSNSVDAGASEPKQLVSTC
jgi:hypothetical protein